MNNLKNTDCEIQNFDQVLGVNGLFLKTENVIGNILEEDAK